jgi:peptide/nickel transport system permease protein
MALNLKMPVTDVSRLPRRGLLLRAPRNRRSSPLLRRLSRLGHFDQIGLGLLAFITVFLVFVPLVTPHAALDNVGVTFAKPGTSGFLLGTDEQSRDLLSRVLIGMRTTWFAALLVIASGIVIGGAIGLVAGMTGGWVDSILMRITDVFLALPGSLLALAVVSALGASLAHTLEAVMIVWWPFYARIVRGEVRAIMSRSHVEAARMGGSRGVSLAVRHVLPGTVGPVLVTASLDIGALILTLAGLSFLGLGSPAPAAELGAMSARGLTYLLTKWWVPLVPALGVFVLVFIANVAGDAVRDLAEES